MRQRWLRFCWKWCSFWKACNKQNTWECWTWTRCSQERSTTQVTQRPVQPRFGTLQLQAFPQTKITFKSEEISGHQWDSGKYNRAADGDSNKGFCRVFWTVEKMLRELSDVPRCLLWRRLRCYCPILVSCSINVSIFHITWLDTFWTNLTLKIKKWIWKVTGYRFHI